MGYARTLTSPWGLFVLTDGHEQYVGGFKGEWQKAPSGVNQTTKLELLAREGVRFDAEGRLVERQRLWAEFKV